MLLAPGVPATLDAGGFNRHTFMCGQSGSGKTYSLGLVLEQLLVATSLRMVILDPNSDYVRLAEVRDDNGSDLATRYAAAAGDVTVWGNARRRRPTAAACSSPTSTPPPRRPCSGSTRSRTARSTPRWPGSWPPAARARR